MSLFTKTPLYTLQAGQKSPINPDTLFSYNPTCTGVSHLDNDSIRLLLTFESTMGVNIGSGMRITLGVNNEVSILCAGAAQIIPNTTVEKFSVSFGQNKKSRIVTFIQADGSRYALTCNRVIIESHEQYCVNEDGTRQPIAEAMQQYNNGQGDALRTYLSELKQKRLIERPQN